MIRLLKRCSLQDFAHFEETLVDEAMEWTVKHEMKAKENGSNQD